ITGAAATTAGEEEDHILALVLAHPVRRSRLVVAKAVAVGVVVGLIAVATWVGMLGGVALAGGRITVAHMAAFSLHLAFFGFGMGALALALGTGTGRRTLAVGVAGGVGLLAWLINAFAPLVSGLSWLKYVSPFYYYAGHDPISRGVSVGDLVVLGLVT